MFQKLEAIEEKLETIERQLADPSVIADQEKYLRYVRERAEISGLVEIYRRYKRVRKQIEDNNELLDGGDEEIKELAKGEMPALKEELESLEKKLKLLLLPRDPRDEKNVLLEIRAGTGGEEAALFAADLFRMYARYAENNRWKVEMMSQSPTGLGGFKEVIALIEGKGVYSRLKYEGGVHRVQRIPATESQGRIHTSAVTVAILPEAEDVEVEIKPDELRIDVYRSSGPGGQSVNTTDSAVRVTHIPSGLVVTCQDEKSQHKNKAKALKILRSRLLDQAIQEQQEEIAKTRKNMVGSGDRSERIRTYNYPQNRVSDHRIGLTLHRLEQVMEGAVDEIFDALSTHFQTEALKEGWSNSVEKIS
jgi:peptide chain release factor 1